MVKLTDLLGNADMHIVRLACWALFIVAATFAVHELAHGLMGAALGYDVFVRVNSSGLVSGDYRSALDRDLIDAAGPAVTLLQGLFGLWLAYRWPTVTSFAVVLAALLMRMLAAGVTLFMPNDEARLGLSWGVGLWSVHAVVIAALLIMTVLAARWTKPSVWSVITLVLAIKVGITAVVMGERFLPAIHL